jgi:hypothetical protein
MDRVNPFYSLYKEKKFMELSREFIRNIEFYGKSLLILNRQNSQALNNFVADFLELFCRADFIVPNEHQEQYFDLHPFISNLVCISEFNTTDQFIEKWLNNNESWSESEFCKFLILNSARNKISPNYAKLFDFNPEISSLWYMSFFGSNNYVSETSYTGFQRHLDNFAAISPNLILKIIPTLPFFSSTYIHPAKDRPLKEKLNSLVREGNRNVVFANHPKPGKIGIVSQFLEPAHSVYKGMFRYIESLSKDYELTLVHLGNRNDNIDRRIFKDIVYLEFNGSNFDRAKLSNDFSLVFYPDIGMSTGSIILSNLRLAPVQVTGHGHSVSTYGSLTDYFITGSECEYMADISNNYSERPVVIPGLGLLPARPVYPKKDLSKSAGDFVIICPWSSPKINYQHLLSLKKILEYSARKIKFRFIPGLKYNSRFNALEKELTGVLGKKNIEIYPLLENNDYMYLFEDADMAIDSWHFGGYNTIVDALYLAKPVITLEGNKAYNRFGSALLRKLGLAEMVCTDPEEYINKILLLINNENYRNSLGSKLKMLNPENLLFNPDSEKYFNKAIAYLLENQQRLKGSPGREPIIING